MLLRRGLLLLVIEGVTDDHEALGRYLTEYHGAPLVIATYESRTDERPELPEVLLKAEVSTPRTYPYHSQ